MIEQYNRLSGKSQERINALLSRADNLFCHQWLRKAMFNELKKHVMDRGGVSALFGATTGASRDDAHHRILYVIPLYAA